MRASYRYRNLHDRGTGTPPVAPVIGKRRSPWLLPTASLIFMLAAFSSRPAYANNPPGTVGEVLFVYLIPVAMIVLTTLTGGYTIINRLKPPKPAPESRIVAYLKTAVKTLLWLFIIFWSLAFAWTSLLLCVIFGVYALYRSGQMIRWGIIARRTVGKPDYLHDAKPSRLISSGCALACISIALSWLTLVFVQHGTAYGPGGYMLRLETSELKSMASLEKKRLELSRDAKRQQKELDALASAIASQRDKIRDARRRYVVEHRKDGKSLTIFLLPAKESMIFTYPSYRVDFDAEGKGTIKRAWVSSRDARCPEDAMIIQEGL